MRIILAIDSLKGCLTSQAAEQAAEDGIRRHFPDSEIVKMPMTDGGDGMLDAFIGALGAQPVETRVRDAMMRHVTARYAVTHDNVAIIESAEACGLAWLKPEERNPLVATSYGVGELMADAWARGCQRIIIGLGGSATSDCGLGMLHAIIDRLPRRPSQSLIVTQKTFDDITLPQCPIDIISDVRNPLYGPNGAAAVFGPQKGATPAMVRLLDRRAATFARMSASHLGRDCSHTPGAGAAGGLGYALMEYLRATMHPGAEYYLRLVGFDELLENADLVVTGEGSADGQTLMGKIPAAVMRHAKAKGIPCALVAGKVSDASALKEAGFAKVLDINEKFPAGEDAMNPDVARHRIAGTAASIVAETIA